MSAAAGRVPAYVAAAAMVAMASVESAGAQTCPMLLSDARRLVLVTADSMNAMAATLRLYQRASSGAPWQALGPPEPALLGKAGLAWSHFFRQLSRDGEPIKVEGDKRTPAGVYTLGRSFGTLASKRPDHVRVASDTICVDDPRSPAYNTITSRAAVGPGVHAEQMGRAMPMYRRGLLVDYPTDARRRAGSCIFIHVWRSPTTGTAGCIALPEARVMALQDFAAAGAVLAVMPRAALGRLPGCLPDG
jgi:D-alanyl-D-alanine dipeptidase